MRAKKPRSRMLLSDFIRREWPTRDNRITGYQCSHNHILLYWRTPESNPYDEAAIHRLSFDVDEWVFFRQVIWKQLLESTGRYSAVWFGANPALSYRVDKVDGVVGFKCCECTLRCSKMDVATPCAEEDESSKPRVTLPGDEQDWFHHLPTRVMIYEEDFAVVQDMFAQVDRILGYHGCKKAKVRRALIHDFNRENMDP